ncbi:energy-coupling factor transporter transmembrane protein EcfT [Streptococcus equi subsp. zooepidemicus]|uniref:energy-coupling factor transporter transmembrane component T n=1 Tax=Streptococcus equi TaxID=1336 RepID=UPI001E435B15|nr:energy-coupling factor transporter transmembrane component T [Streptococcus equi]MCD3432415.1 energy-coupling factor transporter transmembrane protein EcfT [Streptococcus equi subsp. zooepidemicus]HEL0660804.1 energy-coupling factor transporter transmembrane protein EcfT [Streptococcus equi subsp. zooepidemicus]HEL0798181.1 energy-coupling factor transporter transmembrane protein EcfT [Streptococcus equi subsp. zooepidemicus]HEL1191602.1 energy-coupling factor transporter transmembrane prote
MRLDVRTKLLLLILANACFFFRIDGWLGTMIISVLLGILFWLGQGRLAIGMTLLYALLLALSVLPLHVLPVYLFRLLSFAAVAGQLLYPSVLAALIFVKTTSAYELVNGLRKWHVPEVCLLTLAVMLRFLPKIRQEGKVIRQSLKIRGIFLDSWAIVRQPRRYMEYLLVPLLMSLLRSSQDLTIASLTKGLAIKKGASECFVSHLSWKDWGVQIWIFVTIAYMVLQ